MSNRRFKGNTCRLAVMMVLVAIYFVVELVVGHITNSIALVADSFHMLSDLVALGVGMAAIRISKWPRSSKNTFGWQRAEVLGTLVNTVILVTLCFTILIEAIQRFIKAEPVERPQLMVGVGLGGLLVNLIGLAVLWGQGHGHGHSHAPIHAPILLSQELENSQNGVNWLEPSRTTKHRGSMGSKRIDDLQQADMFQPVGDDMSIEDLEKGLTLCEGKGDGGGNGPTAVYRVESGDDFHAVEVRQGNNHHDENHGHSVAANDGHGHSHGGGGGDGGGGSHMNMKAVLLHVLADALGSVIVVISALLLWFAPGDVNSDGRWKVYVDPVMSVIMVTIVLGSAIPLLRTASLIVLQSVPKAISLKELKLKLEEINGIHEIHDLHVWQLQSNCIIGTVHLRCNSLADYVDVSQKVKNLFHDFNIHCTTIQPEFTETQMIKDGTNSTDYQECMLSCGPSDACKQSEICCPTKTTPSTRRSNAVPLSTVAAGADELAPLQPPPGDNNPEQSQNGHECTD